MESFDFKTARSVCGTYIVLSLFSFFHVGHIEFLDKYVYPIIIMLLSVVLLISIYQLLRNINHYHKLNTIIIILIILEILSPFIEFLKPDNFYSADFVDSIKSGESNIDSNISIVFSVLIYSILYGIFLLLFYLKLFYVKGPYSIGLKFFSFFNLVAVPLGFIFLFLDESKWLEYFILFLGIFPYIILFFIFYSVDEELNKNI